MQKTEVTEDGMCSVMLTLNKLLEINTLSANKNGFI